MYLIGYISDPLELAIDLVSNYINDLNQEL